MFEVVENGGQVRQEQRRMGLRVACLVVGVLFCALVAGTLVRQRVKGGPRELLYSDLGRGQDTASLNSTSGFDDSGGSVTSMFVKMINDYESASEEDLDRAGISRHNESEYHECKLGDKGCMEEDDKSFNALKYMIWQRQNDPELKKEVTPEEKWGLNAIQIAERIAGEASEKAAEKSLELSAALRDLPASSGEKIMAVQPVVTKGTSHAELLHIFASQTAAKDKEIAKLKSELMHQVLLEQKKSLPKLELLQLKTAQELKKISTEQHAKDVARINKIEAVAALELNKEKLSARNKEANLEDQVTLLRESHVLDKQMVQHYKVADAQAVKLAAEEKTKLSHAMSVFRSQLMLASGNPSAPVETLTVVPVKKPAEAAASPTAAPPPEVEPPAQVRAAKPEPVAKPAAAEVKAVKPVAKKVAAARVAKVSAERDASSADIAKVESMQTKGGTDRLSAKTSETSVASMFNDLF